MMLIHTYNSNLMQKDKSAFNSINKSKSLRHPEDIQKNKQLNQPQKKNNNREGSSTQIRQKQVLLEKKKKQSENYQAQKKKLEYLKKQELQKKKKQRENQALKKKQEYFQKQVLQKKKKQHESQALKKKLEYQIQRKKIETSLKKGMINQQDKKFLPVLRQSVTVNLYNKSNQSIPYVVQIVPKISQNIIQYIPDFKKQSIKNESLGCKFQDLLSENVLNAMENLDKINNQQKQKNDMAILILKQIINKPLDNKSQKQDAFLKLKIKQESSKQQNSPFYLLELLKNNLQNQGRQVRFTEKADFKTELCLKSLATGFLMDRKMCTVKFQDQQTQWSYDQIASNNVKLINFQKYFRDFVTKKLGINGDNITIHSIKKGSILVTFSTNQTTQLQKAVDGCSSASRYALHPYFSTFNLSPQMFDSRGDINFFNQKHEVQYRGGWPYYQPIKCKRFGLNVLNKFDEKDNSWLSMKGIQGQWVSAFHGVTRPDYKTRDGISILNSIMQGQKINNKIGQQKKIPTAYLKSGSGQYYKDKKSVNGNGNESVGVGIYCTPHIQQTFLYSEPIKREGVQKQYRLIFQCRVNPQKIKVCPKQEYWVINQSKDIRPYGIILMQQSVKKSYPTIENQFKQKFKYENFKNKIMKWKNNQKN